MKPRVLVVDDDPNVASMLTDSLEMAGYRTTYCTDAAQALIQLEGLNIGVLVMDIMMPVFGTGVDAYQKIRSNPNLSNNLPVIFLTGMKPEQAMKIVPKGDPYVRLLNKPTTLSKLVSAIEQLTGGKITPSQGNTGSGTP